LFVFDAPAPDASPNPEDAARRKAWLVRLGAIGMDMAEKTKADFDAAETPQERREAMGEFPAVARLVQRAIFLEAKLERDDRIEARLVDRAERELNRDAVLRRKESVQAVVERLIDVAYDGDARIWPARRRLQWQLNDTFLEPDFADRPIDQIIGALCRSLGLPRPSPIGDDTDLWAINLRKQPRPVPEPAPLEAAREDNAREADPLEEARLEDDFDPLDPFEGRVPIQSSA
jgi:hypothetical protein